MNADWIKNLELVRAKQKEIIESTINHTYSFRKEMLLSLKKSILKYETELIDALFQDYNKPQFEAIIAEIAPVINEINHTLNHLKKWMKPQKVGSPLPIFPSSSKIERRPFGMSYIISPWNYPVMLSLSPVVSAIAGGNSVVLRLSESTPKTAEVLEALIEEAFPNQFVKVVRSGREEAEYLLTLKWDFIFFTGSPEVGKKVYQAAAAHLTPVVLELGGKSPCIVTAQAPLKHAAKRIVWAKFLNAGQTCVAPDHILVESSVKDQFVQELIEAIRKQYPVWGENCSNYAHLISDRSFQRLSEGIKNETVLYGGESFPEKKLIKPTLIDTPDEKSLFSTEEIFGPILPIIEYRNEAELEYHLEKNRNPLAFYYFGKEGPHFRKLTNRFPAGGVCINDLIIHLSNPNLPFGGRGTSGMGSYHGKWGFDSFTIPTAVLKKLSFYDPPLRFSPHSKKDALIIRKLF